MGLSLHYSGSFRESASLSKMISEVKDIVEVFEWDYNIYLEEFPKDSNAENSYNDNIYGISFTPPKCETLSLCFLSNRKMSCLANLKFYGKSNNEAEKKYLYMQSVKTQYAGVEIHKFIIELFRHLKKQDYFETLRIIDEGKYWETEDENLLKDKFKENENLLDNFTIAMKSTPLKSGESYESYFKRLINMINKRNKAKFK